MRRRPAIAIRNKTAPLGIIGVSSPASKQNTTLRNGRSPTAKGERTGAHHHTGGVERVLRRRLSSDRFPPALRPSEALTYTHGHAQHTQGQMPILWFKGAEVEIRLFGCCNKQFRSKTIDADTQAAPA